MSVTNYVNIKLHVRCQEKNHQASYQFHSYDFLLESDFYKVNFVCSLNKIYLIHLIKFSLKYIQYVIMRNGWVKSKAFNDLNLYYSVFHTIKYTIYIFSLSLVIVISLVRWLFNCDNDSYTTFWERTSSTFPVGSSKRLAEYLSSIQYPGVRA